MKELVEIILLAAEYLDEETIIKKLPFITPDEVEEILRKKAEQDAERLLFTEPDRDVVENEPEEE